MPKKAGVRSKESRSKAESSAKVEPTRGTDARSPGEESESERNDAIRISQDEFNLAVFPIAVLDKRAQRTTTFLTFSENITSNGKEIQRTWTVLAHPIEGLPSTVDEDVYVALMELSHEQGGAKKVYFSRYDLIRRLGWPMNAKHYDRLESSLRKLAAVRIEAKNAYVDRHTNRLVDVGMSIIQEFKIFDETTGKKTGAKSYVMWSDRVAQSLSEKLFKKLDAGFYFNLDSPIAKRLFRYLDKKFGGSDYFVINARKLAFEHIGMSRDLAYASQIIQRIEPAINELIAKGFLSDWHVTEETLHFHKNPNFGTRIQQLALPLYDAVEDMQADDLSPEERALRDVGFQLEAKLIERGMIPTVARRLMESLMGQGKIETVSDAIAYFDKYTRGRKPGNPGGFLYTLIVNGPPSAAPAKPAGRGPGKTKPPSLFTETPAVEFQPPRDQLQELELGYIDYLERTGEELLAKLKKTDLKARIDREREELLASDKRRIYERWSPEVLTEHLKRLTGRKLAVEHGESFTDWCARQGHANVREQFEPADL